MNSAESRRWGAIAVMLLTGLSLTAGAGGGGLGPDKLQRRVLAKAPPDECFFGVGDVRNMYAPGMNPVACEAVGGMPKVNQAYVWGLVKCGDKLWFGTVANTLSLVLANYMAYSNPILTDAWVSEFGYSNFRRQNPQLPWYMGDWRPSHIYMYDTTNGQLTLKDFAPPPITAGMPSSQPSLLSTLGLRSAGATEGDGRTNKTVFLAGPGLVGGINVFAYNGVNGQYMGAKNFPAYNNIRKWRMVNKTLYTTVGKSAGGGAVLRWFNDPTAPGYPFVCQEVGRIGESGAEIAEHDGRLFVSTWPSSEVVPGAGGMAGLWMSPKIPTNGLNSSHSNLWTKIWRADQYEPSPLVASTYGGGALISYDGWLYWGTMHVPLVATLLHFKMYGSPSNSLAAIPVIWGTWRSIALFRGQSFGKNGSKPKIELLYGSQTLPVYNSTTKCWVSTSNKMGGAKPKYGIGGFCNIWNNYTWTMDVFNNRLYVGTMDWGFLFQDLVHLIFGIDDFALPTKILGADLFCFPSSTKPAVPVSIDGVGNYSSYGIRTMISDSSSLFLGMANPMNLLTDPADDRPEGGWELIELTKPK